MWEATYGFYAAAVHRSEIELFTVAQAVVHGVFEHRSVDVTGRTTVIT